MILNHKSLYGSVSSQPQRFWTELDCTSGIFGSATSVRNARANLRPRGRVFHVINPGLVNPTAGPQSFERACYEIADELGIVTGIVTMGLLGVRMNSTAFPAYLEEIGALAKSHAVTRAADGIWIDYCAWQARERHQLGAPEGSEPDGTPSIYPWVSDRWIDLAKGLAGIDKPVVVNSYGANASKTHRSGPLIGAEIPVWYKAENIWCLPSDQFGDGTPRLASMLIAIMAALRNVRSVIFVVNPSDSWSTEDRYQHCLALWHVYCAANETFPGRIYWDCSRTQRSKPYDIDFVPIHGARLAVANDAVMVHYGSKTFAVRCPDNYREPLRLESVA